MSELDDLNRLLGAITDDIEANVSYVDLWAYVKVCEIIKIENIKETGFEATLKILKLYDIEEEYK